MQMVESCVLARLTGVQREWRACKLKFQFDTYPTMMEMFWLLQIFDLNQKPNHGIGVPCAKEEQTNLSKWNIVYYSFQREIHQNQA